MWFYLACSSPEKAVDTGHEKIYEFDDILRISDGMVLGTHNSYHLQPDATTVEEWNYSHPTLTEQLQQGVRQFELDIQKDPDTGELLVLHVPVLDPKSSCIRLDDCLNELRQWSINHPWHFPLQILLEPKDEIASWSMSDNLEDWENVDKMLFDTFDDTLMTPQSVQGSFASLREAVLSEGWPLLSESRGKVLFVLLDRGIGRDSYTQNLTSLDGRNIFPLVDETHDFAAYFLKDDPFDSTIAQLAEAGFLIRTRGDAGLLWDENRVETAIKSGANAISTDLEESRYWMSPSLPVQCAAYNHAQDICQPTHLE